MNRSLVSHRVDDHVDGEAKRLLPDHLRIVVDLGVLEAVDDCFYTLSAADVHDMNAGGASKEVYAMETHRHGVRINRHSVFVRRSEIVSLSSLEDVIRY